MKLTFIGINTPIPEGDLLELGNFTGNKNIPKLEYLVPSQEILYTFSDDAIYADYVLRYDAPFRDLMSIIYRLYENKDVNILYNDTFSEGAVVVELLRAFIFARYDIVSNVCADALDLSCRVDCEFSVKGLYNLDLDKDRYIMLIKGLKEFIHLPIRPEATMLYRR